MGRETMTSRERAIRTLNREPVDRFPIDLGAHMSTAISMFAYWNLRRHLGLPTATVPAPDVVQGLARVAGDVLERFHRDCLLLEPPFSSTVVWNPRGPYRFEWPAAARPERLPDGGWVGSQGREVDAYAASTRSTTSWAMCSPRTSSPCSTRRTRRAGRRRDARPDFVLAARAAFPLPTSAYATGGGTA